LKGLLDGAEQFGIGPGLGLAQGGFDLGPHHLDRIEVGAVGRKEPQFGSAGLEKKWRSENSENSKAFKSMASETTEDQLGQRKGYLLNNHN
jgi:hypothetical protein